jgi:hypothetical protein
MKAHGKKFRNAAKTIDIATHYQPRQAIDLVKSAAFAKFDETVEVAVRLGVDPRHADQVVRGTVVLPSGTGKSVRVLVIAVGDKAREAEIIRLTPTAMDIPPPPPMSALPGIFISSIRAISRYLSNHGIHLCGALRMRWAVRSSGDKGASSLIMRSALGIPARAKAFARNRSGTSLPSPKLSTSDATVAT